MYNTDARPFRQLLLLGDIPGEIRRCNMKISARNVLAGKITSIKPGTVNDEIVVKLTGGDEIVAIITKGSSTSLKLSKNKKVYAIIKASSVMIGID